MSIRMFRVNGLGPQDGRALLDLLALYPHSRASSADSLGGDLYWAAGLSLISDIPKRPQWPVKLHGFVNLGRLDSRDKCTHACFSHVLGSHPV